MALENDVLRQTIQEITEQTRSRLGSPKPTIELEDRGIFVSRPRVARLMKVMGIRSVISKKFKVCTTESDHPYAPSKNLLERDFTATQPGVKWVSDITYVRTQQGWLYLTVTMEEFMRRMKDMAQNGGGPMSFYGSLPDSYKVAINGNHPMVDKVLKAESEEEKERLAKQAFDLALLSQGLLTGKDLTAFVKRSVEMI